MSHSETAYDAHRLEQLLTVNEVGGVLGLTRASVYRLINQGELEAIRVGKVRRFAPADIRDFLERRRERKGEP